MHKASSILLKSVKNFQETLDVGLIFEPVPVAPSKLFTSYQLIILSPNTHMKSRREREGGKKRAK